MKADSDQRGENKAWVNPEPPINYTLIQRNQETGRRLYRHSSSLWDQTNDPENGSGILFFYFFNPVFCSVLFCRVNMSYSSDRDRDRDRDKRQGGGSGSKRTVTIVSGVVRQGCAAPSGQQV